MAADRNDTWHLRIDFLAAGVAVEGMVRQHWRAHPEVSRPFFFGVLKSLALHSLGGAAPGRNLSARFFDAAMTHDIALADRMIGYLDEQGRSPQAIYRELPESVKRAEALFYAEKNGLPNFAKVLRHLYARPL